MKVWRVEHGHYSDALERPVGPYRVGAEFPATQREGLKGMYAAHQDSNHPSPSLDPKLYGIEWDEVCGMVSRQSLDTWFDGWPEALNAAGFTISVYEVPKGSVRFGGNGQVVFKIEDAKRVGAEFWEVIA